MTKFQKVWGVALSLCFFIVLAAVPGPFFLRENVYRQLPLYCFLEEKALGRPYSEDRETYERIVAANGEYLGKKVRDGKPDPDEQVLTAKLESENQALTAVPTAIPTAAPAMTPTATPITVPTAAPTVHPVREASAVPHPVIDLSSERLANADYLLNNFFIVDDQTDAGAGNLNAARFLKKDMTMKQPSSAPQILIYHTHASEAFADSREGVEEDTVVGVGNYLTEILTKTYGYNVIHIKEAFDMKAGWLDRSAAYDYAREYLEPFLMENPGIEVIIDLHRDGVPETRHLLTEINGKSAAQIMFYNGLSYTLSKGRPDYLPNSYIDDNLAFSFQMEYEMAKYYPEFSRGIYLAGYRYNLHLRPKSVLLEAGAQTNTVQEVKNAMEPFADILNRVLKGGDK